MALAVKKTHRELTAVIEPDDGGYFASCPEVDVVAGGGTPEAAFEHLLDAAIAYATEYMAEFERYAASPNRAPHVDFVRLISDAGNADDVRRLFVVEG